jgi:tRNA(fMet)-specific endonuclease VapC
VRVLLDTNRYRDFCEGDAGALDVIRRSEWVTLSFVSLAELRAGFVSGTLAPANEANLARFLNRPRVRLFYPDEQTTHHYARLYLQLRKQGTPIPTNDIWIASLALQHNLLLYSRDRHFDHLPQIPRAR